ncbi:MAG: CoA transferase [Gammaproteobacteria bacterium]|nr:CoA transferase [Gammaproteobacteria bacterium]
MTQAFSGVRIVDFTQVLAGPFATQQLALLGAEVIKIEQPGHGDQTRGLMNDAKDAAAGMSPAFMTCNMGKRSLSLNLKSEQAKEIVQRLVQEADVVVENFKAGVMDRLGFGYADMRQWKSDLIYCSISGYGQSGPKAGVPAYDGAIQADSGMMSITGYPETGPTRTGYMPVDMSTALNAAFAISTALYRKLATGEGQLIDVAMMDTAIVMQTIQITNYLATGKEPQLIGNRSPTGHPTANVFKTTDGHINILALREPQVASLFEIVGLSESYRDERFSNGPARIAHYDDTYSMLSEILQRESSAHWLDQFAPGGVPAAAIRSYSEVVDDEQFQHRKTFIEFPSPVDPNKNTRLIRAGYQTAEDGPTTDIPPPRLGEHTQEILTDLGFSKAAIDTFRKERVV